MFDSGSSRERGRRATAGMTVGLAAAGMVGVFGFAGLARLATQDARAHRATGTVSTSTRTTDDGSDRTGTGATTNNGSQTNGPSLFGGGGFPSVTSGGS